jgi:dihydrofolate synthase/folylpolyglutamate synthase
MQNKRLHVYEAFFEVKGMRELVAKDYREAEEYLNNVPRFTSKNTPKDTEKFYGYIGGGKFKLGKIVHVAGTNGKGSVCSFLKSICIESGYKTAMFISPHLITTRERFVIDNDIISEEEFLDAFNWLSGMIESYKSVNPLYAPTYFERLFFMGMYIFDRAGVEVTILETGLGGRLDATNIIKNPVLSVITEIGFDHMAYLGNTLEEIAGEKAGIIKPDIPVVFSDRKKEVSVVLTGKATDCGSKYYPVSKNDYKIIEIKKKSIDFSVSSLYYNYVSLVVNTTALYQVENAAIAFRASEVLRTECGFDKIDIETVKCGISKMHWQGRMEEVRPDIFIDGAHNEDGIEAFAETLNAVHKINDDIKYILIFSAVKDKQYDRMIEILCGLSFISDFVITHIPVERGADLDKLCKLFEKYKKGNAKIQSCGNIDEALEYAINQKENRDRIYIVGSLYLAGIVEEFFSH